MRSTRLTVLVGLWATAIWGFAGVALTQEVVTGSRAADVIAASPLCSEGCPALAGGPSWLAVAVLSAWIVVALGSLAALVVLLLAQRGTQDRG